MMSMPGLTVREADGVLLLHGIAIELRNTVWQGCPVVCVAARVDPSFGLTWRVDHATGELADRITALGAVDQRLEMMWSLPGKWGDENAGPARPDK
jgi:hypothetical protein